MKFFNAKLAVVACTVIAIHFSSTTNAQLTLPATSQEAEVTQRVGITDITIHYNRPYKRNREIWGGIVHYGFNASNFGAGRPAPWRAGADYNTTIEFTDDVKFEGKDVKAGKYALFMAPKENGDVTIVLSSNTTSWGSFFYDEKEDVLRVDVKSRDVDNSRELLTYEFNTVTPTSTTATLHWDKKEIPFKIEVAVTDIVMRGIENDLRNPIGFNQSTWDQAAGYAFRAGKLDKALEWVNASIEGQFFSKENYSNLSLKGQILMQQGNKAEALKYIEKSAPLATNNQTFGLVNQLINAGEKTLALKVAKDNLKRFNAAWPSNYILSRAYSANNNYKSAIKSISKALEIAPGGIKPRLEGELKQLQEGKDFTAN